MNPPNETSLAANPVDLPEVLALLYYCLTPFHMNSHSHLQHLIFYHAHWFALVNQPKRFGDLLRVGEEFNTMLLQAFRKA